MIATRRSHRRMERRERRDARSFTLLEAVIAVTILAAFTVATLQLRAQGLASQSRFDRAQSEQRAMDEILRLAAAGMLREPERVRDDDGNVVRLIWRGQRFGESYECARETVEASNPAARRRPDLPATIEVHRYTVQYAGRSASMDWIR